MSDWKDKQRERVKDKQQGNTHKMVEGPNCMRVLPNKKDLLPSGKLRPEGIKHAPCAEFKVHWGVGPDEMMVACGHDIDGGGACWLCDKKIPELEASDNRKRRLQAQRIKSQDQFLTIASRVDPETQKFSSPKPWPISGGGGAQSLSVRVQAKLVSNKKDYIDPVKGFNLNIERTGAGLKTRYPEVDGDESPSKVPLSVLTAIKPLEDFVPKYSEEKQKAAYYGKPLDDEDEDDAPRPKKSRRDDDDEEKPRAKKRRRDEDEEEEEYGESEESEEEAEEEEAEEASDDEEEAEEEEAEEASDGEEEAEEEAEESDDEEEAEEEAEESDDEEETEESDDEEEAEEEEAEEETEEEAEEEEEEPEPPKKKAKPAPKKAAKPAPKPAPKKVAKPAPAPAKKTAKKGKK